MSVNLTVKAGNHARNHCPIKIPWSGQISQALNGLGSVVDVQRDEGFIAFILNDLAQDKKAVFTNSDKECLDRVKLEDTGDAIKITLDGSDVTTYHYANIPARPYFWPVLAPNYTPVTRAWPLRNDVAGETRDHIHHRSMYFAFGDVNGVDNWSEEPGHGYTVHKSIDELTSGPVFGRFATTSEWTDNTAKPILEQKATVTVWRGTDAVRLLDFDLRLNALYGDVRFGDTKEGGLLSVRVASEMDVPRTGRIENSFGGVNEAETWGKSAHWCDYSGVVNGNRVGIAIMDHPLSFRYPTYWHVRDYGLMTANPFALHDYTGGLKEGSHTLKMGETLRFVYRAVIHLGDAAEASIRERYLDFVSPPTVEGNK